MVSQGGPASPVADRREMRRYRTGRNQQRNQKVRAEDATFYAIADANGWVLGETFAPAIAALQRQLPKSQPVAIRELSV